jgi:cellulose synthase/poly-beta-1,6-N-acetylglucosamine synthase-like glycosyltransferase
MTILVTTLLLFFLAYYLLFLWDVRQGLDSEIRPLSTAMPFVSVIVAARNEEHNIQQCVQALTHQEYNRNKYELIIVDDHSRDRTSAFAKEAASAEATPVTTLLALSDELGTCGKPAAIARGIEVAKGEIILCTDADCSPPARWISSMVRCFEPSVAFVAGPVMEGASPSIFSGLQRLEFLGLITTAAGLIGSGNPIICNGASIGYRKSAFQDVQGYGKSAGPCDDETLMQRMLRRNIGQVVFNFDSNSTVLTPTPATLADFFRQRIRWASKRGHYEDKLILARLMGIYFFFLFLFLSMIITVINPSLETPVLVVLLIKVLAELAVLTKGARIFRQRIRPIQFLVAELFHVPYIVLAGLIGQIISMRWKDRNLGR